MKDHNTFDLFPDVVPDAAKPCPVCCQYGHTPYSAFCEHHVCFVCKAHFATFPNPAEKLFGKHPLCAKCVLKEKKLSQLLASGSYVIEHDEKK